MLQKYFGDKAFYKKIMLVAIPIMIQNGMTNFVNLLDNIMVGRVGAEQMSGVAIVNQVLFVFNLCIFGAISGAGIFSAQFFGKKDIKGVSNTFRYKLWVVTIITACALVLLLTRGEDVISLYLTGENDGGNIADTLMYGKMYMRVMLIGLPAFIITQVYASTLREAGETIVPMIAGVSAVLVDLVFNYLLIYGNLGLPKLGVVGAAIATMMSRYVEAAIVVFWTHFRRHKFTYIIGIYKTLMVPKNLLIHIIKKGFPLFCNEALWSAGMAILVQCYSVRGFGVVGGLNIANTIGNLFNIVFFAMGDAIAIIVGQLLGSGQMEKAKDNARKMITFAVCVSILVSAAMFATSNMFPGFYNVNEYTRNLATTFMRIAACYVPMLAFLHASYFTLRSGGNTIITFLFDSVFMWIVSVPLAYVTTRYTSLSIAYVYIIVQGVDIIKCIIGFVLVKKEIWLNNIVAKE